jgi:hypothetical protein
MTFVLRVDDCAWTPEKKPDKDLAYFRKWREWLWGDSPQPAYYGFIPAMLGEAERKWLAENLLPCEHVAVHGWDHARGAVVTVEQMRTAREQLGNPAAYIAPFNAYNRQTVLDWGEAGGSIFFGGFPHETRIGDCIIGSVRHAAAVRELYDHAPPLIKALEAAVFRSDLPVVTMHCTWDCGREAAVREVGRLLRDKTVEFVP